jgi:type VI secretion system secreted protein VgrG
MELYDFPGEYAQRFDGIDPGGGDRAADLQKIFEDNKRTVGIRMQQEAAPALRSEATSNCHRLVAGYKFTLARHFNADGDYLLVSVQHTATMNAYRSQQEAFSYTNRFACIPLSLPFRPLRVTPRPSVRGSQSAVVVGPAGEEIFTDKYGRVKVQFHWDREGKKNADSSCWIRVATHWAGKSWGGIHLPRIGQEVIVDFLEGDPDNPIIVGSVYNADQMPPWALPANKTQSGIISRSTPGGATANFNELRFEDKKGSEYVYLHAEKDSEISVEHDESHTVGNDRTARVEHDETERVMNDRTAFVANNENLTIAVNRSTTVGATEKRSVGGTRTTEVGGSDSLTVGGSISTTVGGAMRTAAGGAMATAAGAVMTTTAGGAMTITAGAALTITAGGVVAINASAILLNGRLVLPLAPVPIV